jgi:DNA-3-methyladenine glycosylase II
MPRPSAARNCKPSFDWQLACRQLAAADPKLGRLIARCPPGQLQLAGTQSPFQALAESIIYQQLHGKAAATIHRRMLESFHPLCGVGNHPTPQHILDCPNTQLRTVGLSANKQLALRDLAAKTLDGTVPTLAAARRMSNDALIERLTRVRGIGRWTVEMFLIFRLGRPDVLPVDDFGVRKGFALTFLGLKPTQKLTPDLLPKPAVMIKRAAKWAPWFTVASWYLWRACDLANEATVKSKAAAAESSKKSLAKSPKKSKP